MSATKTNDALRLAVGRQIAILTSHGASSLAKRKLVELV
jgi:hypothetical protein